MIFTKFYNISHISIFTSFIARYDKCVLFFLDLFIINYVLSFILFYIFNALTTIVVGRVSNLCCIADHF